MPDKAHVTSVDAIEAFRSALLVYISKARPALEEVSADVLRLRIWLEGEQRVRWEAELRRRMRALEQAQQTLFSSRLSKLRDESPLEVMAVHRAKQAVEEAQHKLKVLKQWNRNFESRVQPLVKQLEKFHSVLSLDLPKAGAHLAQITKSLEAYAEVRDLPGMQAPSTTPPPVSGSPPGGARTTGPTDARKETTG
jgi:hypothetical protein